MSALAPLLEAIADVSAEGSLCVYEYTPWSSGAAATIWSRADQPSKLDAALPVGCGSAPFAGDHSRELAGASERLVGAETQRAVCLQAAHCVICDMRNQNF